MTITYAVKYSDEFTADVPENVGEYTVKAVIAETANYNGGEATADFTILKKSADVIITANNLSKVYGETDPELTVTVTGLIGEDKLNYTLSRVQGENAGEYIITVTLGENPNYDVVALNGIFTITKKAVTVTANELSKVYGDADPELTYTVEGLVAGDTLTGSLARAEGEAVGIYAITLGTLTAGNNYVVDFTGAKLTICATQIETDVNIDENAPEMNVEGINEEVATSLLTEEEKQVLDNGEEVKFYLEVVAVDEQIVPADDKAEIEKEATKSKMKVGMYLDLSLFKKVGKNDAVAIHDTNGNMVKVTVTVPEELRNTDTSVKRTFYVVRVHDGVTTILGKSTEDTVSFETDKFSTYSLMYKDVSLICLWILIAVVIVAVAAGLFFLFFFLFKRRKEDDEEEKKTESKTKQNKNQ